MDISLRQASEKDIPFLLSLRDKTMNQYLEDVGISTTNEEHEKRIRYEFAHAKIVELDNEPIGLFKATYNKDLNYWHLVQIQIDPEYQGLKIGRTLINVLIEKAAITSSKIGLSVIKTNPAQQLYLQMGFVIVKKADDEYLMELQA
ncbi:GNAT family N-acetyltransferase [Vibrio cyclitrophicus]